MSTKSELKRIRENKNVESKKKVTPAAIEGDKKIFYINVDSELISVEVDKNRYISLYELESNIAGLINIKKEFEQGEKIELSRITDTFMDLIYKGQQIINNRLTSVFGVI